MSHSEVRSFELVLENKIQLHRAFCNLMPSLLKYLHTTAFEGDGYQITRDEIKERWRYLNWENPGEEEFNSVIVCLRKQSKMLQEDYRQGREALTRKNLINLAQHLWEYLLVNNSTRTKTFLSMYHEGGWAQFSMQYVTTFEQRVQMLLQFFKVLTSKSKPQASQLTRFNAMNLEEFGILNQQTEPAFTQFDETSNLWPEPFSTLMNCMFPVEYVYSDWFQWQATIEAQRRVPESLCSLSRDYFEAGSRVEGFCIPQFILRNSDIDRGNALDIKEQWQPDLDLMKVDDFFVETNEKSEIPIFIVEHLEDDPKYAKLRLTDGFKEHDSRFKNVFYLNHSYLLPHADHPMAGRPWTHVSGEKGEWSYNMHGPVRKLMSAGFPSYEEDQTDVFKYPIAWPEPAMEWLVRSRPSGWPSSELVQEVFDSGCHLAPVGRGKRIDEPIDTFVYYQNPGQSATNSATTDPEGKWAMEETEWRISFSLAENKLGGSVSPVQRHVMVLLKMIKKAYFPDVISTYYLKNLLFWECESKGEAFWKDVNSARCLLSMLDRLHECLETSHLPHYFMPQSNLLQYDDTANLKEAAVAVAEVRRKILPKTVSLLKRLQSLTFQSNTYLRDVGVLLKDHLLKMQDRHLSEEDHGKLLATLHSLFVGKSKDVIKSLLRIVPEPDKGKGVESLLNIALYAYQSILARNLCKLWFLMTKDKDTKDGKKEEDEFTSFVHEEVRGLSLDDDLVALSLAFFHSAKNGTEPSWSVPNSRAMKYIREEQVRMAVESTESLRAELPASISWLKVSNLKEAAERATKKLRENHTGSTLTKKVIMSALEKEVQALYGERTTEKKYFFKRKERSCRQKFSEIHNWGKGHGPKIKYSCVETV